MEPPDPDTEQLIERARHGDRAARQQLLVRHRDRLCRMVRVRLDRRLAARIDPSDVVQEALLEADRKLAAYLHERPLPFYPWIRRLAWERLVKLHRRHLQARRSVAREDQGFADLPDESALELAGRLIAPRTSPSSHLAREERRDQILAALGRLEERDREVLVLRYLEELSTREIAALLQTTEGAIRTRHVRALQRLRVLLGEALGESRP
jgi:RNA polymerase sigma-70 factor (ECF subfamily)